MTGSARGLAKSKETTSGSADSREFRDQRLDVT